ncbi:unnamed protein product [Brachionus calyciflorus]|uniref:Reverse transcriptase domain-containing protein n=1 Tax=Brachionus calyciflorus TaxID=104777 RepID=A0A814FVB7_9BILA|nr:unnamed protein product [Brachionus calyciflorus]
MVLEFSIIYKLTIYVILFKLAAINQFHIEKYERHDYKSDSGFLKIRGTIVIKNFIIDPNEPLTNIEIKMADCNIKDECVLGMDIIGKIAQLNQHVENVKALVDEFPKLNYENFDTFTTPNSYPHILSIEGVNNRTSELGNQIKDELSKEAANDFNDLTPIIVFVDDLLVHSSDEATHLQNIMLVIERFARNGFKIKLNKCVPLAEEIKFLGHVVYFNSIKPDEDKIAVIKNYPLPEKLERLQSLRVSRAFIENSLSLMRQSQNPFIR